MYYLVLLCLLSGCSGFQRSEEDNLRRLNAQGEKIYRSSQENAYPLENPISRTRDPYPWEKEGKYAKITKEHFHCKGSLSHPPHTEYKDPTQPVNYFDCGGRQKHSLPIREHKEFIYPILIDLLNYLQDKIHAKVVITCGYRCPTHNSYADPSSYNQNSKHTLGAEVDFYVEGWENKPEQIVDLLMQYYPQGKFERLKTDSLNVKTPPWYNEEILIKLYQKEEGRDFDNQHPYPYISIQVRYDKARGEKVLYDFQKAFNCYRRY